ncbi:MAG TPA: DUF6263 family protein [Hanamia sp.]
MRNLLQLGILLLLFVPVRAQKVNLSLNLKKGETYTQVQDSKSTVTETINGQTMNIGMSVHGKTTYLIQDLNDKYYMMEVNFRNLNMEMELPQGSVEFSSSKNDTSDIVSTLLSEMTNKPFYIKMTRTGKIDQVNGLDSLFHDIFKKFPQLSEAKKQQLKTQLMKAFGEKGMKGSIEMVTAIFPEGPVSKGDKWIIHTQLESAMSADLVSTFVYEGSKDSTFIIHGDGKIQTANKDAYIETNGMPIKYDLAGTMTSEITVDKNTGWIVNAKVNQEINGNADVKDNPKMPGGLVIPMSIKNVTEIKGK